MNNEQISKAFFPVTSVCFDDIIFAFEGSDQLGDVKKRLQEMDENDMKYLASKMANDYCEQLYWISLANLFEEYFLRR